ncbi:MAG: hypothetical protein AAGF26_20255 [Cyanobacteria bacterium P01_G01_bin.49]
MLQGIDLINCAKANAKQGVAVAAKLSGYGEDYGLFIDNLKKACQDIGVDLNEFNDLITDQETAKEDRGGREISPDTTSQL